MDGEIMMPARMSGIFRDINIISTVIPVLFLIAAATVSAQPSYVMLLIQASITIPLCRYICCVSWYETFDPRLWMDEHNCYRVRCVTDADLTMIKNVLQCSYVNARFHHKNRIEIMMVAWCKGNIGGVTVMKNGYVHFRKKSDAALFVMYRPMLVSTIETDLL